MFNHDLIGVKFVQRGGDSKNLEQVSRAQTIVRV